MAPKGSQNGSKMGPGPAKGGTGHAARFQEGLLEGSWNALGGLPGAPGSFLDAPEGLLVESGTPLERSWSPLGPSGGRFESSWGPLGSVSSALGAILVHSQKTLIFQ